MEIIPSNTSVDFLSKRYFAFILSALLIGFAVYEWVSLGENKYGIDYLGGHEIVVKVTEETNAEMLRGQLQKDGIAAIVQAFEAASGEFSIRIAGEEAPKIVKENVSASVANLHGEKFSIVKSEFVGPTIGKELQRNALIAIIVSLFGMLAYITYRFEMAFAVGAVAALFHDVVVTLGIYLICGKTIGVATLAAALTIVGYSVNDTIIVFDRVREELLKRHKQSLKEVINYSINQTLSRTVITSLLTLFSAVALWLYGGGGIADLSLFLVVGIICGTYSTIFIASPVALAFEHFRSSGAKNPKPSTA